MTPTTDLAFDRAAAVARNWRERLDEELKFAEALLPLHPEQRDAWLKLIEQAKGIMAEAACNPSLDHLAQLVQSAEQVLAPIGKVAKTYHIWCVGHAHIDMNWMWSWPETVAITNDTFTTALKLMDEFPDFCLTQSQGAVYDLVRQYNPELFERIKQRVKEGRWEVVAASWVEGDKNISSGESLARHLQYTRQFMKEHFGLESKDVFVQWEPDTFGHARTIPSIVTQGGVRCYYMCRGGMPGLPAVFWWSAPDGSRVLVNRETDWYNNALGPHAAIKAVKFCTETGLRDWMIVYGVGDHGGGPTRRDLRRRQEMDAWPIFPNFRFAAAKSFFEKLLEQGDRWPTLDRELNFEFAGCYTSQSSIKKANRAGENLMVETELAATLANRAINRAYPAEIIKDAWLDVLFSQFHDILPGSGVRATRDYNQGMFQRLSAAAGMVKTQALRALADAVDTSFAPTAERRDELPAHTSLAMGGGAGRITDIGGTQAVGHRTETQQISSAAHVADGPRAVVVFNPCAWDRQEVLTVSVWDADADYTDKAIKYRKFIVRDSANQIVPAQPLHSGNYWGHDFVDLAFPANVGALGYSAYSIEETATEPTPSAPAVKAIVETEGGWRINQPTGRLALESEHLLVEFDRKTGGIKSLLDKASGWDMACPNDPMALLEYVLERPHGMSAWILADAKKRIFPLEVHSLAVGQNGPHVCTIIASVRIEQSRFDVTYSLQAGSKSVGIEIAGTWLERGGSEIGTPKLLMRFPLNLQKPQGRYEIPFGSIRRDYTDGREMPALRWVDVSGTDGSDGIVGCALLNDCKYGHSLEGNVLRETLIRSSYDPDPLPEMGEHRIHLALVPHVQEASAAELLKQGAAHNHPLIAVNTTVHTGKLPAKPEFVARSLSDNVVLTHVKVAETGGLILRLQETAGQGGEAKIQLNPAILGPLKSARIVDLLEKPVTSAPPATLRDAIVSVTVPAMGIVSVEVR
jgi:alpha-mannosidase